MNLRFGDLEKYRANPRNFYETGSFSGKLSKFMRWQYAVGHYHKFDDVSKAETYLTTSFASMADTRLNRRDLIKYTTHLHEYDENYRQLKSEKIEYKKNIQFELPANHQIKGQIPRIDVNTVADGYSVYFFAKELRDWENELMFPVLQGCIADYFGCDPELVNVGLYILDLGRHVSHSYSIAELNSAQNELQGLIVDIANAAPDKP